MLDNRHPSPIANSLTSLREPTALACGRDLSNQRRAVRRGAASAGEVAPSPVPAPAPQDASSDRSGWQSQGFLYIRPDLEHRNRPAQSRAPPPRDGPYQHTGAALSYFAVSGPGRGSTLPHPSCDPSRSRVRPHSSSLVVAAGPSHGRGSESRPRVRVAARQTGPRRSPPGDFP